jgi:hypothetical protein
MGHLQVFEKMDTGLVRSMSVEVRARLIDYLAEMMNQDAGQQSDPATCCLPGRLSLAETMALRVRES